nr:MAPEG family protein [Aeromonas veronii]
MTILPVYAALLALLFVLLSIRTIRTRHSRKVALGHGDDPAMLRAMRVHANFAEYVPPRPAAGLFR